MTTTSLARFAVLCALILPVAPLAYGFDAGSNTFPGPSANEGAHYSDATNIALFTAEVDEPGHGSNDAVKAANTAWWTYTAPESGYCTVDTLRGGGTDNAVLDTVIAVYTGAAVNALTPVARNDDYGAFELQADRYYSRLTFYAQKDTVYRIAADAYGDSEITANKFNIVLGVRLLPLRKTMRNASFNISSTMDGMGMISLITTGTGSFSGKLTVGAKVSPMKGTFGVDGLATVSFERKAAVGSPPLAPITLVIDGTLGGDYLLTIPELGRTYDELYEQSVFTALNPNTLAGAYTAYTAIGGGENAYGVLSLSVKPTGAVTGVGTAPDGTPISFGGALHTVSNPAMRALPMFKTLFGGKGALMATFALLENGNADDLQTVASWYLRPAAKAGVLFYPLGLSTGFSAIGGAYVKPAPGARALGFLTNVNGDGAMSLTDQGAELGGDITELLNLSVLNKFTFDSLVRKPALTLNATTGAVTGSITAPPLKKRTIKGILSRNGVAVTLRGYVTGSARNLRFQVTSL